MKNEKWIAVVGMIACTGWMIAAICYAFFM